MKPYAFSRVNEKDQKMFSQIKKIISRMPEVDLKLDNSGQKRLVSCHTLARAIATFFPMKVHDGYFFKSAYHHSWLTTKSCLIDVYPIAVIGGPILIDSTCFTPWSSQYVDQDIAINAQDERFLDDVKKIVAAIDLTIKKLKIKVILPRDFEI